MSGSMDMTINVEADHGSAGVIDDEPVVADLVAADIVSIPCDGELHLIAVMGEELGPRLGPTRAG